jgi:hypothetical protein
LDFIWWFLHVLHTIFQWCFTPLSILFQLYRGGQLYLLSFFNLCFPITSSIFSNDYFIDIIKRLLRRHHQTITSLVFSIISSTLSLLPITSSIFSNDYFVDIIKRLFRRHHQTITSSTSANDYFIDIIKRLLHRHHQTITSSSSNDYFVDIIKRLLLWYLQ